METAPELEEDDKDATDHTEPPVATHSKKKNVFILDRKILPDIGPELIFKLFIKVLSLELKELEECMKKPKNKRRSDNCVKYTAWHVYNMPFLLTKIDKLINMSKSGF